MTALAGVRVAVLESRMGSELAALIRRRGGEPFCVPSVSEERTACGGEVAALLDALAAAPASVIVLTTGVGVSALFSETEALGRAAELRRVLESATVVCRGPKPTAALAREGIAVPALVREPYTTAEVVEALAGLDLAGRCAVLVHYGERSVELVAALSAREARVRELVLYAWKMPADTGPLRALVDEIVRGDVGAVVFTSQVQVRHLFEIAAAMGRADVLGAALRARSVVAAVGPTCARALEAFGVDPNVMPARPKMGPLVAALDAYLSRRDAQAPA